MVQDILILLALAALALAGLWALIRRLRRIGRAQPRRAASEPTTATTQPEAPRRAAPRENPETAAAGDWGDVTGLRLPVDIDYLNQKGERSQRRVMVFAAEGNQAARFAEGWATRFRGRCLLANAQREFRVDGVQRLADPTTGEVAETPREIAQLLARRIEEEIAAGRGGVRGR